MGILLIHHIKWWAKPYNYPSSLNKYGFVKVLFLLFGGILLFIGRVILLSIIWRDVRKLLIAALNLDSLGTKRSNKKVTKFCSGLLMALISAEIAALPGLVHCLGSSLTILSVLIVCRFAASPDIAWCDEMKNSWNGFNTRIDMDGGQLSESSRTLRFRNYSNGGFSSRFSFQISKSQPGY